MSWEKTLDEYGALIDQKLNKYFVETVRVAGAYHPFIGRVYRKIGEYVLRKGKRLASCSTLLTYKGYAGSIDDRILNVCVGIELYRHCILVHDDLIDQDDFRRGGKTLHRSFAEFYDDRLGKGVAVFIGDVMYSLALQCILDSGFEREKLNEVIRLIVDGYRNVNESQMLDLLFEYMQPNVHEWYIMASKRAASLFKTTILMGAILGGATQRDLRLLEEATVNIGYSFDIQDDIIDTFSTQEQYGRLPGGDLALGKKPLYIIYTFQSANRGQLNTLYRSLGKRSIAEKDLESVRVAIRESGGLDAAKEKSRKHAEIAKALVAKTGLDSETKGFFGSFIEYIVESLDWYR